MTEPYRRDDEQALDALREQAAGALRDLRGLCSDRELAVAKRLVAQLRDVREYELMGRLAEAVSRHDPHDATNRRLYAQYLVDAGMASVAIDLLRSLLRRLPRAHPETAEATGLLGRAYKQIFYDAGDKTSVGARHALKQAIKTYRRPYEQDPGNTWHGVNLVALLSRARALGLRVAPDLHPRELARQVVRRLHDIPPQARDDWYLPTLAEASLGLGDWHAVEREVQAFVASPDTRAFHIASTLRQFTEIWDLEADDARGRELVDMLRARLIELPGGELSIGADELQGLREQSAPDRSQLEAVLGDKGPETYRWWKTGLDRALAVAAVRQKLGGRIGTGFLVHAADLGLDPRLGALLLTNFHVVNAHGASPGIRPEAAEIVFEAVAPTAHHAVEEILWSSPPEHHDVSLLRLAGHPPDIAPLPIARSLPALEGNASVYIIGHPGGDDLAFSFQDNQLLDHEGPPDGRPQIPGVCRVHYHAPTKGGSSGSPVFDSRLWEVIALHHKGGRLGMPRLNGASGTYAANEGISIHSIVHAMSR
jgi:tetratricopeptide (TPR) repeat protein